MASALVVTRTGAVSRHGTILLRQGPLRPSIRWPEDAHKVCRTLQRCASSRISGYHEGGSLGNEIRSAMVVGADTAGRIVRRGSDRFALCSSPGPHSTSDRS